MSTEWGRTSQLAGNAVVAKIKQACLDDDVHISGKTDGFLAQVEMSREALINAVIEHIDSGCKLYMKQIKGTGITACHGSIKLFEDEDATYYMEAKIKNRGGSPSECYVWLQVHKHDIGYAPLPR